MADEPLHEPAFDITLDATSAGPVEPPSLPAEAETPQVEQLHLWHLFLWTACCAVVLGYVRNQFMGNWKNDDVPIEMGLFLFPSVAVAGTALMGLILTMPRLRRCPTMEPGHYLLTAQGVGFLLMAFIVFTFRHELLGDLMFVFYIMGMASLQLPFIGAAIVLGWPSSHKHMERRWRYILTAIGSYLVICVATEWVGMLLISNIRPGAYSFHLFRMTMFLGSNGAGVLILFALIGIAIRDRIKKVPHGWLHRLGVLTAVLWGLLPLGNLIRSWW